MGMFLLSGSSSLGSSQPEGTICLQQKGQGEKITMIDPKSHDFAQKYLEQRARGAYLASICQPEASFDLSVAAQAQTPDEDDCTDAVGQGVFARANRRAKAVRMGTGSILACLGRKKLSPTWAPKRLV
jgi:hypothetical protein